MVDLLIPGPEGKIEAKYSHNNKDDSPIVILLHPDPSKGGTMHTKIIFKMYKIFVKAGFSTIRFNRYGKGQIMRQHHDHIHSLFDGNEKGIPVLSFILNLNDNYRGADLYFWRDHAVHLGKGDIIMCPSLFLCPHGVTEAREGVRYSAVSWAW